MIQKQGDQFEFVAHAFLQHLGYLSRRQVTIHSPSNLNDATDIDVYGIKFINGFCRQVAVIECKDRRKAQPFNRIIWLKGLKTIYNADSAFLYIPNATWDMKAFGYENGVTVIDTSFVSTQMSTSQVIGLSDRSFYELLIPQFQQDAKKYTVLKMAFAFLQSEVFSITGFKKITRIIQEVDYISKYLPKSGKPNTLPERISFHIFQDFLSHFAVGLN